jgi:hypothetical protein
VKKQDHKSARDCHLPSVDGDPLPNPLVIQDAQPSPCSWMVLRREDVSCIEKHRALGIEGYERIVTRKPAVLDRLNFMLGHEVDGKPVFVAGVTTTIFEFGELIEETLRRVLGIESPKQ